MTKLMLALSHQDQHPNEFRNPSMFLVWQPQKPIHRIVEEILFAAGALELNFIPLELDKSKGWQESREE
jgi:hypothetical protein